MSSPPQRRFESQLPRGGGCPAGTAQGTSTISAAANRRQFRLRVKVVHRPRPIRRPRQRPSKANLDHRQSLGTPHQPDPQCVPLGSPPRFETRREATFFRDRSVKDMLRHILAHTTYSNQLWWLSPLYFAFPRLMLLFTVPGCLTCGSCTCSYHREALAQTCQNRRGKGDSHQSWVIYIIWRGSGDFMPCVLGVLAAVALIRVPIASRWLLPSRGCPGDDHD